MSIPIRCFTCGKELANKYNYYCKELIKRRPKTADGTSSDEAGATSHLSHQYNTDAIVINIAQQDIKKTTAGIIMDELGLTRDCCRKNMMTDINIIEDI
jgi:DNA-directed RNA polymerase I, II, and III subunit RPABC5